MTLRWIRFIIGPMPRPPESAGVRLPDKASDVSMSVGGLIVFGGGVCHCSEYGLVPLEGVA